VLSRNEKIRITEWDLILNAPKEVSFFGQWFYGLTTPKASYQLHASYNDNGWTFRIYEKLNGHLEWQGYDDDEIPEKVKKFLIKMIIKGMKEDEYEEGLKRSK